MNTLRLNIINLHAPYRVWQKSGKPDHYYFVSDSGVEFNIDFKLDYAFVPRQDGWPDELCSYHLPFDMSRTSTSHRGIQRDDLLAVRYRRKGGSKIAGLFPLAIFTEVEICSYEYISTSIWHGRVRHFAPQEKHQDFTCFSLNSLLFEHIFKEN